MNDRFTRACRRQLVDATPVWFMRQAGRYMAEYRTLRERHSLIEICRTPELATEVTLQPVARLEVDAAILFSDLLVPLAPLGLPFDFVSGEGPAIATPIRQAADVDRLRRFEPREALAFVFDAIKEVRAALAGRLPLIGFGGAPFTLASYAIEGGHSSTFALTKAFMYREPKAWAKLMELLSTVVLDYLRAQIEAGVQAVQVFDSWVGVLSPDDYREFALPYTRAIFRGLRDAAVPTIHFGTGTSALLADMRDAGGEVIGIDWRIPLDEAWARIGEGHAIQGNLDPAVLIGPLDRLIAAADLVLDRAAARPGHIFNLGHGILPGTPLEHVQELAHHVHQRTKNLRPPLR
ncbi:MAG: uroporphyrinogen decarboxylase [Acidobacteria bacterium]|nr:uroporphyrinogen decarboxylase [Acidobacteriota bacterium]